MERRGKRNSGIQRALQIRQICAKFRGGGVARLAIFFQCVADDVCQFLRGRRIEFGDGTGRFGQDGVKNYAARGTAEGQMARGHFVKHGTKLNMSVRASSGWPRTCSGDMYWMVPGIPPAGQVLVAHRIGRCVRR